MAEGHTIHQNQPASGTALSDEQFNILVDLLAPVHELAVRQLAILDGMVAPSESTPPELPADFPASTDD